MSKSEEEKRVEKIEKLLQEYLEVAPEIEIDEKTRLKTIIIWI